MGNLIKYNCIFGGGGIRGMAYIGAIKALEELNIEIASIAGSSVGAVFAAFLAVGYSHEEIKKMFLDFNLNMFRDLNFSLFPNDISISKGEIFLSWLREKIGKKLYKDDYDNQIVKFKDLKKDLFILTIDLNTNTPYIFSKENTPEEEVAIAVRASAGLPGLMKPINMDNSVLVDGDLIKSWPAWKIFDSLNTSDSRLLEFRLEGSRDGNNFKNPIDYLNSIINTIWYLSTENVYNDYAENDRYDYIVIDTKDLILFDFTVDKNVKDSLVEKGYNVTRNYFTKVLPDKKRIILSKYELILSKLKLLSNALNQNNPKESIYILNEILSDCVEFKKYTDESFYRKMKELKEAIILNTKKQFLMPDKIINDKQMKERNNFIKMLTEERILDLRTFLNNFSNKS